MLNRLPLRIEYRAFRHHPDVCFHGAKYNIAGGVEECRTQAPNRAEMCAGRARGHELRAFLEESFVVFREEGVFEAHIHQLSEFAFAEPHLSHIFVLGF